MLKLVVPIKDGKNGETARGGRSQASMLSPSQCVSKSMEAQAQSIYYHFAWETLHRSIRFGSVSLCISVENVILGHVSPGSAGSARWTKSSSGVQPG